MILDVQNNSLLLTRGPNNAALALYRRLVYAGKGFVTTFNWQATNCGGDLLTGGDG